MCAFRFLIYILLFILLLLTLQASFGYNKSRKYGAFNLFPIKIESFTQTNTELNARENLNKNMFCYSFPDECKKQQKVTFSLENDTIDGAENFPSVDGKKKEMRSMFMFANNRCSPKCCPSEYTCGHGCLCLTDTQKCWLNRHGISK